MIPLRPFRRAVLGAILLAGVTACHRASVPATLAGQWRVATWGQPGAAMLVQAEVMPYLTATLQLGNGGATFGDRTCESTDYAPRGIALSIGETDAVRLFRPKAHVTEVFELTCRGVPWTDPGRRLVVLDDGALVTEWRGRFFLLERRP